MDIKILEIRPQNGDKPLKAFADIRLGEISIRDFRVIKENGKRLLVAPPQVSWRDKSTGSIRYKTIITCPDELKGEAPKAFIQLKEGETSSLEEIRAFCKTRMAPYKVPTAVAFVDEIPRSAAGKALRRLLRDQEWGKE